MYNVGKLSRIAPQYPFLTWGIVMLALLGSFPCFAKTEFRRYINGSLGTQQFNVKNDVSTNAGLSFKKVYPYSIEVGIIQGSVFSYGLRVDYIQHTREKTINSAVQSIRYTQVPVMVVWGLNFGETIVFRPNIALGYALVDTFTVINSASADNGVYETSNALATAGADLYVLAGGEIKIGLLLSAGYKFQDILKYGKSDSPGISFNSSGHQGYYWAVGGALRF